MLRCNRKQPFSFNKRIYKLRWRIESAFKLRKMLWNAALRRYYPTVTTSGFTDLKDFFDAAQDQQIRYRSVELMVHPGAREYREESELLVEPWRDRLRFQSTLINFNNLTEKVARSDAEQPLYSGNLRPARSAFRAHYVPPRRVQAFRRKVGCDKNRARTGEWPTTNCRVAASH